MLRILFIAITIVIGSSIIAATAGPDDDARDAVAAMKRGDWNKAIDHWSREIDSGKLDQRKLVPAYGNRAASYSKLEKLIEALSDFSKSLELASGSNYPPKYIAYNYSNRAGVYIRLKRYQLAIQDADQAIKLNGQDYLGFYYRGRGNMELGQREAAIADFRAALRINPKHNSSRAALARLGVR